MIYVHILNIQKYKKIVAKLFCQYVEMFLLKTESQFEFLSFEIFIAAQKIVYYTISDESA
jgi:hypothetical protein